MHRRHHAFYGRRPSTVLNSFQYAFRDSLRKAFFLDFDMVRDWIPETVVASLEIWSCNQNHGELIFVFAHENYYHSPTYQNSAASMNKNIVSTSTFAEHVQHLFALIFSYHFKRAPVIAERTRWPPMITSGSSACLPDTKSLSFPLGKTISSGWNVS
jgi:hypothetical protein